MTLGVAKTGVMFFTGDRGRGLEGDEAESDFERQHISQVGDGVWLTYVQNWQTHWKERMRGRINKMKQFF